MILDDAFNYLRLHDIVANHCTVREPPRLEGPFCFHGLSNRLSPEGVVSDAAIGEAYNKEIYIDGAINRIDGEAYINRTLHKGRAVTEFHGHLRPRLLVWSSADEGGVGRLLNVYGKQFTDLSLNPSEAENYLKDLVYTLTARRSSLAWKSFAIVRSTHELQYVSESSSKPVRSNKKLSIGLIFTGQGVQYSQMGQELLVYPVFQNTLRRCGTCLREMGCGWSLMGRPPLLHGSTGSSPAPKPLYGRWEDHQCRLRRTSNRL